MNTYRLKACRFKLIFRFLIVVLTFNFSSSFAANILVSALPGENGCDLIEAIDSANTNSAVGGCAAGQSGQDVITFRPDFTRYELSRLVFSSVLEGSSGTPLIVSQIKIVGPGDELMVIARSRLGPAVRLFTVALNGDLTIENLSLQDGAQQGGGVDGFLTGGAIRVAGKLTLDQLEIANSSAGFGGAIWVQGGEAIIRNSLFRNNSATNQGGGIGLSSNSRVTIYDSTFSSNSAGEYGGGLAVAASPNSILSLYNATISENSAGISGGGISALFASIDSGESSNYLTLRNTIISGNTATVDNREVHIVNPFISARDIRNNILGSSDVTFGEATNSTDFLRNDNIVLTSNFENTPLRSVFAALSDNGGKTMTHALVSNSPAIGKGLPSLVTGGPSVFFTEPGCRGEFISLSFAVADYRNDQRDFIRPSGGECDIGSFEYEAIGPEPVVPEPIDETCHAIKAKNDNLVMFCL